MPLYGRSFTNTDGLGKPFQGTGQGSWEQGVWDFKALPQAGAQEHIDEEAGASYSYDPNTRTMISYDTVDMALKKTQWIKQRNLGGAMWWELSGDRQDAGSIISNVRISPLHACRTQKGNARTLSSLSMPASEQILFPSRRRLHCFCATTLAIMSNA